jgi:DNA-binding LacI/PurR family transcriptional regulator
LGWSGYRTWPNEVANGGILVLADPFAGLREAVAHLTALGHFRIAYIGGALSIGRSEKPSEQSVEAMRLEAFRSAIRYAGLPVDDALIRLGPYYPRGDEEQPGAIHVRHLLQLPKPPTAVIAGSDLLAAGALQAIHEAGRKVPEDVSIIGYDNTTAEIMTPPLTSISQPIRGLGQRAVQLAIAAIEGGGAEDAAETFATRLVVRRSTARAPSDSNP